MRLPLGIATDKWGGRIVHSALLLAAAGSMCAVSLCDSYGSFVAAGLGFGLCGASFAVGIAYTSLWFSRKRQGLVLGIFGVGNAGAAATTALAPTVLEWLTAGGEDLEGWRGLPRIYAALLAITGALFFALTKTRVPAGSATKTLGQRLAPLGTMRAWRFGLYYFFVFGGFVALSQWLVPYYLNAYGASLALAGLLASIFSLPSGAIRALGGWMSDRWGGRRVMYWVFGSSLLCCGLLFAPQMDIHSPGSGVMAVVAGTVTEASPERVVIQATKRNRAIGHPLVPRSGEIASLEERRSGLLVWPRVMSWQEPVVEVGDTVAKKELVARGVTHIFFQANIWIFTVLSLLAGLVMGIGMAGVYKHIPEYFPHDVGSVGGVVGVIGGLGGFVYPVLFGYLLNATGLWTSAWMFLFAIALICLVWMHRVVQRMLHARDPHGARAIERHGSEPKASVAGAEGRAPVLGPAQ
jgi:NNP family nitrate/nitrite transporter-like MFS transporter